MGIVFFDFERKERRQRACHAFVSELSFLCCPIRMRYRWIFFWQENVVPECVNPYHRLDRSNSA